MTHTPGPWAARGYQFHIANAGEFIGECYPMNDGGMARARANAALIAAAPELLAALQALIAEYEPNLKTFAFNAPRRAIWEHARAAIARATDQA